MSLLTRTDTMQARLAEAEARIERLDQELANVTGEIEDALGAAGVWHNVDCEVRTYTEAVEVLAGEIKEQKAENARLREAGARLVAHIRGGDHYLSIRRDTYSMALDEDCRVFEDGR